MKSQQSKLLGILAATAALGIPTTLPERERTRHPLQGNQGWGRYHEPKVRQWRSKERAAKTARKINWA